MARIILAAILLNLAAPWPTAAAPAWDTVVRATPARTLPAQHPHRCRGSTRAHVAITWPTAVNLATNRRLKWGTHIPHRIRRWAYLIVPDAWTASVDPYLIAGLIQVESSGDPLAWNLDSDARGLMQVLHASFEPVINVRIGVSMFGSWQNQFGSRDLALAAYNAGSGAVQQYGGIPPFRETRDYVVMVDYYRDRFAGLHLSSARIKRFNAALADLRAYYRKICGRSLQLHTLLG